MDTAYPNPQQTPNPPGKEDVLEDVLQAATETMPQAVTEEPPQAIAEEIPPRAIQDAPRLAHPNLIVFVSNVCIMVLELVAERIVAPHVGVSLYTWTTIIGIVLAGISLGNTVGGRLADRWASRRLLGIVFTLGGLASLAILGIDQLDILTALEWPLIWKILVLVTAMFFFPAAILGTVSPIVARLAVNDLSRAGRTVGRIYAAGSFGSIVGTFATGFVLTWLLGTHIIVIAVAGLLLLAGLTFFVPGE
ncbi:MAG: fused MFS/spermidine synthase [Anaerolineae bacterium]|nr:fused MFS/spermidine synthase [Anaerolineae bacterium]